MEWSPKLVAALTVAIALIVAGLIVFVVVVGVRTGAAKRESLQRCMDAGSSALECRVLVYGGTH